ncbi:HNH endonuclease [Aurantimonas sp. HBX-1]|uniref:HNH endonuclease n=1 Tax=Aurantimonas sp. HBX-1 TaxID=2906072 RepID=UPI00351D7819
MPYLEGHHMEPVARGGLDEIDNIAALCPNCHRHIHYGINGMAKNNELLKKRSTKRA